jgi:hypothetical protein
VCVICGGSLEDGRSTPSDGVAFDCPKHGAYTIARTALPRVLGMDVRNREAALERAKLFAYRRGGEVIITSMDL